MEIARYIPSNELSTNRCFDKKSLTQYLSGETELLRDSDFPTKIDIEGLGSSLEHIAASATFVPHSPQFIRELLVKHSSEENKAEIARMCDTPEEVERMAIIYLDRRRKIRVTPVSQGERFSVGVPAIETLKILLGGGAYLFEVHTHPFDALFSHPDYARMISKGILGLLSKIRGGIVLCPGIQIMALATDKTLKLPFYSVSGFLTDWYENNYNGKEQVDALNNECAINLYKGNNMAVGQDPKLIQKMADAAFKPVKALENKIDNTYRIAFARDIGVKLYASTDYRNFTAFSA